MFNMSKELTNRQKELLDFLKSEFTTKGIMPSTREIQTHFGFKSQTAAMGHLRALEKKGVIQRLAGKRSLTFTLRPALCSQGERRLHDRCTYLRWRHRYSRKERA